MPYVTTTDDTSSATMANSWFLEIVCIHSQCPCITYYTAIYWCAHLSLALADSYCNLTNLNIAASLGEHKVSVNITSRYTIPIKLKMEQT